MRTLLITFWLAACSLSYGQGFGQSIAFRAAASVRAPSVAATTNQLAWWKLWGNATDSGPNGYNGTLIGSPSFGSGPDGFGDHALALASNQSMVASNTTAVANGLSSFTVMCWVFMGESTSTSRAIMCKVNATGVGNTGIGWAIRTGSSIASTSDRIGAYILDGTNREGYYTSASKVTIWTHVALAVSGSTATVYINGSASGTTHDASGTVGSTSNTSNIMIGQSPAGEFFGSATSSLVSSARIYNYVLSSAAILAIFTSENGS